MGSGSSAVRAWPGSDFTFVRPGYLSDKPATGRFRVMDRRNPPGGNRITRADLAAFVVAQIDDREFSRGAPSIAQ